MKKNKSKVLPLYIDGLLIFLFMFLSVPNGMTPDILQIILLFIMVFRKSTAQHFQTKMSFLMYVFIGLLVLLFVLQYFILDLNISQIIYLVGINKVLYTGIIVYLFARNYLKNIEVFVMALNIFLLYLNLGTLLTNLNGEDTRAVSFISYASFNYIAALNCISLPIIFYFLFIDQNKKNKISIAITYFVLALSIITIIVSGSRIAVAILALEILFFIVSHRKRVKMLLISALLSIVGYFMINILLMKINQNFLISVNRGLTFYENTEDSSRELITNAALIQILSGDAIFGSGSVIVQFYQKEAHNIILEIILASGIVGLILYLIYIMFIVFMLMKGIGKQNFPLKLYIMFTFFITFGIALFQPFMTTGFTFTIIFWCSILALYYSHERVIQDAK